LKHVAEHSNREGDNIMPKTKSMAGSDGGRKLASDAGRSKHKRAGEPQKQGTRRGGASRTGSSKQRKG
jgi:hypothetical protein